MRSNNLLFTRLKEQILVLDGAMGTMIQDYKLTEEDFRGSELSNFEHDLKGNNDLLSLTQPDIIREIHSNFLSAVQISSKPIRLTQTRSRRQITTFRIKATI